MEMMIGTAASVTHAGSSQIGHSVPSEADIERDSLHILPLSIIPFETPALSPARMIKNVRLESVIEIFHDQDSGSGQIDVQKIPAEMGWPDDSVHPDFELLRNLARLPSYDVYSLRIMLRSLGIDVNNQNDLKLSESKVAELSSYMTQFTRPLISEIFGENAEELDSFGDILSLFRDPDVRKTRMRLQAMADKLAIELTEVPTFLEDFGDIFLSLSYYRQCLDQIAPTIDMFLDSLIEIRKNRQLSNDANLVETCIRIESVLNESLSAVAGRFENFDRNAENMWENISAEQFRIVKNQITGYHTSIGGTLCALSVKMTAWLQWFPHPDYGGPVKRSEFIMSEMKQGIERIQKIEASAPMQTSIAS